MKMAVTTRIAFILSALGALAVILIGGFFLVLSIIAIVAPTQENMWGALAFFPGLLILLAGVALALPLIWLRRGSNVARIVLTVMWIGVGIYGLTALQQLLIPDPVSGGVPPETVAYALPQVLIGVVGLAAAVLLWVGTGVEKFFSRRDA